MATGFSILWFRSRRRPAAWLALLALALQLGLSFGHVHGIGADHPVVSVVAAGANQAAPSRTNPGDHDDDYCAICAVLALLNSAQTAAAPVLAPPVAVVSCEIECVSTPLRIGAFAAAFRSRAPPLS